MPLDAPLRSLERWRHLSLAGRWELACALAEALGDDFEPLPTSVGPERLVGVLHAPSGTPLVAIPGGTIEVGFSSEETAALRALADGYPDVDAHRRTLDAWIAESPRRSATLDPFLVSRAPLLAPQAKALGWSRPRRWLFDDVFDTPQRALEEVDRSLLALEDPRFEEAPRARAKARKPSRSAMPAVVSSEGAVALAGALGARLLSEIEWERVARAAGGPWIDGRRREDSARAAAHLLHHPYFHPGRTPAHAFHPFGLWGLGVPTWVMGDRAPRLRGGNAYRYPWQGALEEVSCHVATPSRDGDGALEVAFVARDVPAMPPPAQGRWLDAPLEPLPRPLEHGEVVTARVIAVGPRELTIEIDGHGRHSLASSRATADVAPGQLIDVVRARGRFVAKPNVAVGDRARATVASLTWDTIYLDVAGFGRASVRPSRRHALQKGDAVEVVARALDADQVEWALLSET